MKGLTLFSKHTLSRGVHFPEIFATFYLSSFIAYSLAHYVDKSFLLLLF